MRILIVENDSELLLSLKKVLETNKYEVDDTNDAILGLSYALTKKYDAILVDLHIQKISTKDFINNLYSHHVCTPIIAITKKEVLGKKLLNNDIAVNDYLVLPFYTNQLIKKIESVIELDKRCLNRDYEDLKIDGFNLICKGKTNLLSSEVMILDKLIDSQNGVISLVDDYLSFEEVWIYVDSLNTKLEKVGSEKKIVFMEGGYKIQ